MTTLRQYFDTDFRNLLRADLTWSALCEGKAVEVLARANFDFDAGVKFASYYLPACENVTQVCMALLEKTPELLRDLNERVLIEAGYGGKKADRASELKFSGRVFLYSEVQLAPEDVSDIERRAGQLGQTFRFRSQEMVQHRSAVESPQAFISHDWRDKSEIARPLAIELSKLLCFVWYDEFALGVGDSLRERIETGLKACKKCILVLSPHFLSNTGWTKVEFNSIFTRELVEKQKIILPVWCGVTAAQVYEYSPALADRLAANWDAGPTEVARLLYRAINSDGN